MADSTQESTESPGEEGASNAPDPEEGAVGGFAALDALNRPPDDEEAPDEEDEPNVLGVVDEQLLGDSDQGRAVNEALRSMSRAARSFLIYDTNNESILRFLQD